MRVRGNRVGVPERSDHRSSGRSRIKEPWEMITSLDDPQVRAAFDQAAQSTTKAVKIGQETRTITTPFPSPEDWRDVWIYFLMIDRFNRSDGKPPRSMPYDKPFGEFQGGTFNGVRERLK